MSSMTPVGGRGLLRRWRSLLAKSRQLAAAPPVPASVPPDPPTGPPLQTSLETIKAWSEYSKDRFDSEASRIVDFRNWGRQLAAGIAVVIAFEVNAIVQLVIHGNEGDGIRWATGALTLLLLMVALWRQARALTDALHVGYRGDPLTGPESPAKLGEFILGKDEWEASRLIGAYYAKAYGEFYQLAEDLSKQVAAASKEFRKSLRLLFGAVALLVAVWLFSALTLDMFFANHGKATSLIGSPFAGPTSNPTAGSKQSTVPKESSSSITGNTDTRSGEHARAEEREHRDEPMSNPTRDSTPAETDQLPDTPPPPVSQSVRSEVGRLLDTPTEGQPITKSEKSK